MGYEMRDLPFTFFLMILFFMGDLGMLGALYTHDLGGAMLGGILGIVVGSVLGMGLMYRHKEEVKKVTGGVVTDELLDSTHTRVIDVALPYQQTVDLCKQTLNIVGSGNILAETESQGMTIHAEVRLNSSQRRFKQYVTFKIDPKDGFSRVMVKSETSSSMSRGLDYGASLETIQRITRFLEITGHLSTGYE
jgi:hypothetical protein